MFSFFRDSRHGGLAIYPTLLSPAAKHDPSEATSVTDRSAHPVPAGGVVDRFKLWPREAMRADAFGLLSLLNPSCDKAGRTPLELRVRNRRSPSKRNLVPRCFACGSACSVTLRFLLTSRSPLPGYEAFHTISVSFEKKPEMIKVPCLRRGQGSDPLSWNGLLEGASDLIYTFTF